MIKKFNPFHLQNRITNTLDPESVGGSLDVPPVSRWSLTLTRVLIAGCGGVLLWSVLARIPVSVSATGTLDAASSSPDVQASVGGVVDEVLVRDGQRVRVGDLLFRLRDRDIRSQLEIVQLQRKNLASQLAVLRAVRAGKGLSLLQQQGVTIPPDVVTLLKTRQLLIAKITGDNSVLSSDQIASVALFRQDLADRQQQTQVDNASLSVQLASAKNQVSQAQTQLQIQEDVLRRLQPLVEAGGLARNDYLQKVSEVNTLRGQLASSQAALRDLELSRSQVALSAQQGLSGIRQSLEAELTQVEVQLDSLLNEKQQQLFNLGVQTNQLKADLEKLDIRAPAEGLVFNLDVRTAGSVVQASQTLAEITPDELLVARLEVLNPDIGEIKVGMPVDLRIEAFPFSEYGVVKGKVARISSNAVPFPSGSAQAGRSFYPVEVEVEEQKIQRGETEHRLLPGMTFEARVIVSNRAPIEYVFANFREIFEGSNISTP